MRFNSRFFALLLALSMTPYDARAERISIRSDYWFPYNGEPGAAQEGYMIDLLRQAAKANGDTIDYRLMDWEVALERTLAGVQDCVVGAIAEDAPQHALSPLDWGRSRNVILALDDATIEVSGPEDLRSLRIGAVADYAYGDELDAVLNAEGVRTTRVEASRRAFPLLVMKLVTRKVDVIIEDENVATAALSDLKMTDRVVVISGRDTEPDALHVACSNNERGRRLIAMFDKYLAEARASGELATILARYGLTDWASAHP